MIPTFTFCLQSAMGYQPGKGLGASGTGRLEPIEASQQRGRRGLGHTVPRLKQATSGRTWDQEKEVRIHFEHFEAATLITWCSSIAAQK